MIDIQIKPQINAINLIIDHERDKSIAQGGYLDTCRDYRLPSLNFGKNAEVLRNIPGQHPKINSKS